METNVNWKIRGTFVLDNNRKLVERVKRGENQEWICNYLYNNPGSTASECRKMLLTWRGIKVCDLSRGQYSSYFYDFYQIQWYHRKLWTVDRFPGSKHKRMVLTTEGMGRVKKELADRIEKWNKEPVIKFIVQDHRDIHRITGMGYDELFPENTNNSTG